MATPPLQPQWETSDRSTAQLLIQDRHYIETTLSYLALLESFHAKGKQALMQESSHHCTVTQDSAVDYSTWYCRIEWMLSFN